MFGKGRPLPAGLKRRHDVNLTGGHTKIKTGPLISRYENLMRILSETVKACSQRAQTLSCEIAVQWRVWLHKVWVSVEFE